MTLAVKETIYREDFQKSLENANQPEWLKDLREKAFAYFTENGLPTVRDEEWKYTNAAEIQNSKFKIQNSKGEAETSELLKEFNYKRNGFTALHLAFADVVLVTIPKETSAVSEPIEFN